MPVYAAHLREIIKKGIQHPENPERPLEGFKIIVDAGNGSGGFLASDVLAPLGADTTGAPLHAVLYRAVRPDQDACVAAAPCCAA
jgi:phosphomannomutase